MVLCIKPGLTVGWAIHNGDRILDAGADRYTHRVAISSREFCKWITSLSKMRGIAQVLHEVRDHLCPTMKVQYRVLESMNSRAVTPQDVKLAVDLPMATPNCLIKYVNRNFPSFKTTCFEQAFAVCMTQV